MNTLHVLRCVAVAATTLYAAKASAQFDLQLPLQYGMQQLIANPAMLQDHKISVGLPSVAGGFNTPFTASDLGEVRDGTLYIDPDQAINRLDVRGNDQRFALSVETLSFNYRHRGWQVGFSHRVRATGHLDAPRGLVQLSAYGNARYLGQELQVMPSVNSQGFEEYAIHGAATLKEGLTIGGRLKYLRGSGAVQTTTADAVLYTDPDYFASSISTNINVYTAGAPVSITREGVDVGDFAGAGKAGAGFGVDIGLQYRASDELQLGLSVRDLGGLVWNESARRHKSNGSFEFRGYEGSLFEGQEVGIDVAGTVDSILSEIEFTSTEATFRTALPTTIQATARYALSSSTTAHGTVYAADADVWSGGFGVGLAQRAGKILHVGALAGLNSAGGYLGANVLVDLWGPQIYVACDNVLAAFDLADANAAYFRAGLNLTFGKVRTRKDLRGWYDTKVEGINK